MPAIHDEKMHELYRQKRVSYLGKLLKYWTAIGVAPSLSACAVTLDAKSSLPQEREVLVIAEKCDVPATRKSGVK